jgi:energy-coupling factor transport system permease protein
MEMIARMQAVQYGEGFFYRLDPRIKIGVVFLFSLVGPLIRQPVALAFLSTVACGYLLAAGLKKTLLYTIAFYTLSMVMYLFIEAIIFRRPPKYQEYLTLTLTMLPIMSGGLLLGMTTPLEKLIAGLERLGVPAGMRYAVMVAMRYVAMLGRELRHMVQAMRVRAVIPGWKDFFAHPIKAMRIVLVPLLIRSFKVADRMGAAAELRGLSAPDNNLALASLRLRQEDLLFLSANLFLVFILWAI